MVCVQLLIRIKNERGDFLKILVHACCAPCANVYICGLKEQGSCDLFWYNPNIHPLTEYRQRRDSLVKFAKIKELELIMQDYYGLQSFITNTGGDFAAPGRCDGCYNTRLDIVAHEAKNRGYEAFSTTLLASPYQNFDKICEIGNNLAKKFGIKFIAHDFRQNYRAGVRQAREMGLYTQKYCGCIFSEEERYTSRS
jgi:predicted adenine nucleotide alpha hydrolase (AANH) superfamily ATPase